MKVISSPLSIPNIRLFIFFRIFLNVRFYYPVFTVLFLDFGLTLEQFAVLNSIWAATIVLLEVPSGALADTIGRRKLLFISSLLMFFEIAILCFLPLGNKSLVFWGFVINRILSGAVEAFASGADEAFAFDSLDKLGRTDLWSKTLEISMRIQSVASIFAMLIGSFVYDSLLLNSFFDLLALPVRLSAETTMRFPLYLVLGNSVGAICVTYLMSEPKSVSVVGTIYSRCLDSFKTIFHAARWIYSCNFALFVICAGLIFDSIIRLSLTLNSQYYRVIELPTWSFGTVGAVFGLMGIVVPSIATHFTRRYSPKFNILIMALICSTGLYGMSFVWSLWGLLPFGLIFTVMYLSSYMVSFYLNQITPSKIRATVLSFKGLAFNLSYGFIGILYAYLAKRVEIFTIANNKSMPVESLNSAVFISSLQYFPYYFLSSLLCFGVFTFILSHKRPNNEHNDIH